MITVYELKNRPCCRLFYKVPYFVKNVFLLLLLAAFLVPIYFAHFRKESIGYTTFYKILIGLNSKTFSYLQLQAENELMIKGKLKEIEPVGAKIREFYTNCVSLSRACKLNGLAKEWRAYQYWRYDAGSSQAEGYTYLKTLIGDRKTAVFVDIDATRDTENFSGFSFKNSEIEQMKFVSGFLPQMSKNAVGMTMRDTSATLRRDIEKDIIYPEFYHNIAKFDHLEVTMGQFFLDVAHYERTDQILCAVDGVVDLRLVPPIYWAEMQPGTQSIYHHEVKGQEETYDFEVNESPVNLFNIDYEKFPTMHSIKESHIYADQLKGAEGDCIFIPAFHFYQMTAIAVKQPLKGKLKPAAITVAFKYKAHSKMLEAFFDAIEGGVLH